MQSSFLNFMNQMMSQSGANSSVNSNDSVYPKRSPSMQLDTVASTSSYLSSRITSSLSFDSIKSQTVKVSSSLLSTIRDGSNKVTQFIKNLPSPEEENVLETRFPSIFEQLKWPNLSLDKRLNRKCDNNEEEEESIVDRFVRVIQAEDAEENPQATFYNHPDRRRNDREEIRRRLAMGPAEEEAADQGRLSLQARLQSGMNLQICFLNETASDCESQCSDTESTQDHHVDLTKGKGGACRGGDGGFLGRQAALQCEARQALGQAKDMARMQMEVERQRKRCSPVTEIIRQSFTKIGLSFPDNKRRLSRQLLTTDMNVAQLQVIVNHLHSQIELLNEELVRHLLSRDDFHMEQDSRLVDIEDLTNQLAAKEHSRSTSGGSNSKASPSSSSTLSTISTPSTTHTPPSTTRTPPSITHTPNSLSHTLTSGSLTSHSFTRTPNSLTHSPVSVSHTPPLSLSTPSPTSSSQALRVSGK